MNQVTHLQERPSKYISIDQEDDSLNQCKSKNQNKLYNSTHRNAWIKLSNGNESIDETSESLIKRARGMLNKLTIENGDKLIEQFMRLKINTEDKLIKLVDLIHDRAVNESIYSELYSILCSNMFNVRISTQSIISFYSLLRQKCLEMFNEIGKYECSIKINCLLDKIDTLDSLALYSTDQRTDSNDEMQKLLNSLLEEERQIIRRRWIGNIKLIGGIYNNGKLNESLIDLIIDRLIKNNDEASFACLCTLLRLIGSNYERNIDRMGYWVVKDGKLICSTNKQKFNQQIQRLEQIVDRMNGEKTMKKNKHYNSSNFKIKFMIMDLLDLKTGDWKPNENQDLIYNASRPRKIKEIHEYAIKKNFFITSPFGGSFTFGDYHIISQYFHFIKGWLENFDVNFLIKSLIDDEQFNQRFFVTSSIECGISSFEATYQIGQLLAYLFVHQKIIDSQHFIEGLNDHLENPRPYDPYFYKKIGMILSFLFLEIPNTNRKSFFINALKPCLIDNKAIEIIGHLVENAVLLKDEIEVVKKLVISDISFSNFYFERNQNDLLLMMETKWNLSSFLKQLEATDLTSAMTYFCDEIMNGNFDDIPKILWQNLSSKNNEIDRMLIALSILRCIKDSTGHDENSTWIFSGSEFDIKIETILPFKKPNDTEIELEIIYSAVEANYQVDYPPGYLLSILIHLEQSKQVSREAFLRWPNDRNRYVTGNVIALASTKNFINRLKEHSSRSFT